jgi:branched-subunit amino acid transport protein
MNAWLTAALAGLVMFLMRATVPLIAGGRELPEHVVRVTRLAAPAVVGALLAASLATSVTAPPELLARLAVLGVGLAVALRTQSLPWTIGAGLAAYLLVGLLP